MNEHYVAMCVYGCKRTIILVVWLYRKRTLMYKMLAHYNMKVIDEIAIYHYIII